MFIHMACVVFLCLGTICLGQKATVIDSINVLRQASLKSQDNIEKDSLNLALIESVKSLLRRKDFHKYDLTLLDQTLSYKKLDKPYFGFISWSLLYNTPNGADSVKYHTHILLREKRYHRLYNVKSSGNEAPQALRTYDITDWYGAIYYDAVPYKLKGDWNFMFLGWRELKDYRQAKIIESVSLKADSVLFGQPKTLLNLIPRGRELLEYPTNVRRSLKFDVESETIFFDNLVSNGASVSPNFSFDGYRYDKREGMWIQREDISIKATE